MKAQIRNGNLLISLPLEEPRPSGSGKTMVVASSRGVQRSTARFDGEIICVNANAFVYVNKISAEKHKPNPGTTGDRKRAPRTKPRG